MGMTALAVVIVLLSEVEWWQGVCLEFKEITRTALVSQE